jgi:multisubunit Na+/H+ antiporter MnhF subunit
VATKARIAAFFTLFFGIFGALMCYRLLHSASAARLTGETTQDLLVPMSSIYTVAAVGMAMLALRGLSLAYSLWYQRDGDVV